MRREPRLLGHPHSRWQLRTILRSCEWLSLKSLGGLSQLLKRLGITYQRARSYIHSPDPAYEAKLSYATLCRMRAYYAPERYVFVYLDEVTYTRQPSLAHDYEQSGHAQPLARRAHREDTQCRGIGALNATTGQVTYHQAGKITLGVLTDFYQRLRHAYPQAEVIYVAQDNWPLHVHPDVLAHLQPQSSPFWPTIPDNWPTQSRLRKLKYQPLPIQLVFLPTYASWLNPIEKLWRWLRQDVLHCHRYSQDWSALKQLVSNFMGQFSAGSASLLHYVGLLPY